MMRNFISMNTILGKSLKEIAGETNQREENVRIKKFRALKKLTVYFKKAGYGS